MGIASLLLIWMATYSLAVTEAGAESAISETAHYSIPNILPDAEHVWWVKFKGPILVE